MEIQFCDNVDPICPFVVFGSKNHIMKGLYASYDCCRLKKIGKFGADDPKLFDLIKFHKKLNECDNILYV